MSFYVELPVQVEKQLQLRWGDLPRAAMEALRIESYRRRKISAGFLGEALGMGVLEADEWLKDRNVPLNYTLDDLQADSETLDRVLGGKK